METQGDRGGMVAPIMDGWGLALHLMNVAWSNLYDACPTLMDEAATRPPDERMAELRAELQDAEPELYAEYVQRVKEVHKLKQREGY